jgi:hypothetical protein
MTIKDDYAAGYFAALVGHEDDGSHSAFWSEGYLEAVNSKKNDDDTGSKS